MKTSLSKTSFQLLLLAIFCGGLLFLQSCGGGKSDPAPTPTQSVTGKLTSGNWKIQTVTVDGVDKTSLFTGFILSFTATNYSTVNGGPVWPASGTWAFTDTDANVISRDGNFPVTITTISDSSLVLTLDWASNTYNGGRVASIAGKHVFTFIK